VEAVSMTRDEIINAVAPCTLMCYTCIGYTEGGLRRHAEHLRELYMGWYEAHVASYSRNPTKERLFKLNRIVIFNEMLEELIEHPQCEGCRRNDAAHWGCVEGCGISKCVRERGIDFCADCADFPCGRDCVPGSVRKRWIDGNNFIKKHGFERYFEENKNVSHYIEHYNEGKNQ